MDARRARFYAALTAFVLWVGGLAVLAYTTGRPPADRPAPAAP